MSYRIALVGATGNVGRGIVGTSGMVSGADLVLCARNKSKLDSFLDSYGLSFPFVSLSDLSNEKFDIIFNASGVCDPKVIKESPELLFDSHESVETIILENLEKNPDTLLVNLSSGAVYGDDFSEPAPKEFGYDAPENLREISGTPYEMYAKTKIFFEKKHRELKEFNIVDIRLFSIFHRYIDFGSHYFLSQIIGALKSGEVFKTSKQNIVKDYIHPKDLLNLAIRLKEIKAGNMAIDINSDAPVKKLEVLDLFTNEFGLKVEYLDAEMPNTKMNYYSVSSKATEVGLKKYGTSLKCIEDEARHALRM